MLHKDHVQTAGCIGHSTYHDIHCSWIISIPDSEITCLYHSASVEGLLKTKIGKLIKEEIPVYTPPCSQISSNDWKLIFTKLSGICFVHAQWCICYQWHIYLPFPSPRKKLCQFSLRLPSYSVTQIISWNMNPNVLFFFNILSPQIPEFWTSWLFSNNPVLLFKKQKLYTAVSNQATFASSSIVKI